MTNTHSIACTHVRPHTHMPLGDWDVETHDHFIVGRVPSIRCARDSLQSDSHASRTMLFGNEFTAERGVVEVEKEGEEGRGGEIEGGRNEGWGGMGG